ncbi:hypothetical protein LOT_0095 [Lentilactobacillus otakiensis DSM 19908 = JCM 15040]|uniref:Uncharacterized protein n=1 Tax=Lentilactobacillus otakiensis DSM 19908 = JCM 15040 TaxID=1423780 RepID=S4NEF7_9LACO|nr:hypothetical protein LOT_0095 [Lentilactobacillus otakiensis DSM 19908 = JCM 15040]
MIATTLMPGVNAKTTYKIRTNVEFQFKYSDIPPRTPEITRLVAERRNFLLVFILMPPH